MNARAAAEWTVTVSAFSLAAASLAFVAEQFLVFHREWFPFRHFTLLYGLVFSAVALFHSFFSWNYFFVPLLYLSAKPELQTLPIAIQQ